MHGTEGKVYSMGETERTIEQVLEEKDAMVKELMAEIEHLEARNKDQIKEFNAEIRRLNGVIEGLKFAIRCNGVSGGEVR